MKVFETKATLAEAILEKGQYVLTYGDTVETDLSGHIYYVADSAATPITGDVVLANTNRAQLVLSFNETREDLPNLLVEVEALIALSGRPALAENLGVIPGPGNVVVDGSDVLTAIAALDTELSQVRDIHENDINGNTDEILLRATIVQSESGDATTLSSAKQHVTDELASLDITSPTQIQSWDTAVFDAAVVDTNGKVALRALTNGNVSQKFSVATGVSDTDAVNKLQMEAADAQAVSDAAAYTDSVFTGVGPQLVAIPAYTKMSKRNTADLQDMDIVAEAVEEGIFRTITGKALFSDGLSYSQGIVTLDMVTDMGLTAFSSSISYVISLTSIGPSAGVDSITVEQCYVRDGKQLASSVSVSMGAANTTIRGFYFQIQGRFAG